MTIVEALRGYLSAFSIHQKFSRIDIISEVAAKYSINETSIIPSDYCYNLTNASFYGAKYLKQAHFFLALGDGQYEYLGENADYSGDVLNSSNEVMGHWVNGKCQMKEKSAWLLTWNERNWTWSTYQDDINNCQNGVFYDEDWACANTHVEVGDRVFLIKLGDEPKGIFASGVATSKSFLGSHYNPERSANGDQIYKIKIRLEKIVDYNSNKLLPQSVLIENFPNENWSTNSSGIEIKEEYLDDLWNLWSSYSNNDVRKDYSVPSAVWIAAATLTYEAYYNTANPTISDMYIKARDIKARAQEYCEQNVDMPRIYQWCNADHPNNTYNYLRVVDVSGYKMRRLIATGEKAGYRERPEDFDESNSVNVNGTEITIGQLIKFVDNEYKSLINSSVFRKGKQIDCLSILQFLDEHAGEGYTKPEKVTDTNEKERIDKLAESGRYSSNEFEKLFNECACFSGYKLLHNKTWLDGSNIKARKYFWGELKKIGFENSPISISIFAENVTDAGARFRFSIELKEKLSSERDYQKQNSLLDMDISAADMPLKFFSGGNNDGSLQMLDTDVELIKKDLQAKKFRKVQLCSILTKQDIIENEFTNDITVEFMKDAVKELEPFYLAIIGEISQAPKGDLAELHEKVEKLLKKYNCYANPINADLMEKYSIKWKDTDRRLLVYRISSRQTSVWELTDRIVERARFDIGKYDLREINLDPFNRRMTFKDSSSETMETIEKLLKASIEENGYKLPEEVNEQMDGNKEISGVMYDRNMILYGPPGTGKTYNSVIYAVAIIENKSIDVVKKEEYEDILRRYEKYKSEGQIAFTTFHQSYGYEEFIEGIRPKLDAEEGEDSSTELEYSIEAGIFKKFSDRAKAKKVSYSFNSGIIKTNPTVWKVSLEGSKSNPTKTDCFETDRIRIGWKDRDKFVSDKSQYKSAKERKILTDFESTMQKGDLVVILYDQFTIDAVGVIEGDYEWLENGGDYPRSRKVKWLVKNIQEDIQDINHGKAMTSSTVYRLNIAPEEILKIVSKYSKDIQVSVDNNEKNYVFIIDEINRGNISKIFGELITLIEPAKRLGASESVTAVLPYSGLQFGVPSNVYILGTMNTADRSIALMDTALRRRFQFIEMMPDSTVLTELGIHEVEGINIAKMLDTMNERIEYIFDREHTIGHAFFTRLVKDKSVECLADIFKKSIIPLLQEYFYEDYGKIQLVLGDNAKTDPTYKFILDKDIKIKDVFKGNPDMDLPDKKYSIKLDAFNKAESYKQIY